MNKIPVGKTIAYAYAFTFGHIGAVIGLTWLPFLIVAGVNYFFTDAMYANAAVNAAGAVSPPMIRLGLIVTGLLIYALLLFMNAVVAVAIVRQALGLRTGGATIHLTAGRDEWRMFGGHLRFIVALIAVFIVFYLGTLIIGVVGAVLAGIAAKAPAAAGLAGIVAGVAMIALACAAIYTLARMGFLLSPSIVCERGGGLKRSYDLTRGNFWRIAAVWVAVGLVPIAIFLAFEYELIFSHINFDWPSLPAHASADASAEFTRRFTTMMTQLQSELVRQNLPLQAMGFVYSIIASGLSYSASAFAYRALVPASASTGG